MPLTVGAEQPRRSITTPVTAPSTTPPTSSNLFVAQLQMDEQALQTELGSLSSKSGVTVADLTQLATDSQALGGAFHGVSQTALNSALTLTFGCGIFAGGSCNPTTASAQSEFTGLFSAANATSAATAVFTDLVKIVTDSHVATGDLGTVRRRPDGHPDRPEQPSKRRLRSGWPRHRQSGWPVRRPGLCRGECFHLRAEHSWGHHSARHHQSDNPADQLQPARHAKARGGWQQCSSGRAPDALELKSQVITVADLAPALSPIARGGWYVRHWQRSPRRSATLQALTDLAKAERPGTPQHHGPDGGADEFHSSFSRPPTGRRLMAKFYSDLVLIIQHSMVTTTDLTTVAADEAAVQTDLNNLHNGSGSTTPAPTPTTPTPTPPTPRLPRPRRLPRGGPRRRLPHHRRLLHRADTHAHADSHRYGASSQAAAAPAPPAPLIERGRSAGPTLLLLHER